MPFLFKKLIPFMMLLIISVTGVFAGVNLKNGNFYISYSDLIVPGAGEKLEVVRTYNSKSTRVGWFGFGWGTEFETRLELSADGSIIIHENGSGAKTRFTPNKPIDAVKASQLIVEKMKKKVNLNQSSAEELVQKLSKNSELRHYYAVNFDVKRAHPKGTVLSTLDRGPQKLHVLEKGYKRVYQDGKIDFFNSDGRLSKITAKNGSFIDFVYKNNKLHSIKDSHSKQIFFSWNSEGLLTELWSVGDKKSTFKYKGKDLISSHDVSGNIYEYVYDQSHNMVKIKYADKKSLNISYDPKTFFVTSITDKFGEKTSYEYGSNPSNPNDHYWTILTRKGFDGKPIKNRYEYHLKSSKDGTRYTHRLITNINGIKTETIYNESSLPLKIARNNFVTNFEYNSKGLLTKKTNSRGEFTYLKYDEKFGKISEVKNKEGTTTFQYDKSANLVKAKNDKGKVVLLIYDFRGKIAKMVEKANNKTRVLNFTYNSLGKPSVIEMEKIGKISVDYDNYGAIKKVDSGNKPKLAVEITSAFQNLLSIVEPAGVSLSM